MTSRRAPERLRHGGRCVRFRDPGDRDDRFDPPNKKTAVLLGSPRCADVPSGTGTVGVLVQLLPSNNKPSNAMGQGAGPLQLLSGRSQRRIEASDR